MSCVRIALICPCVTSSTIVFGYSDNSGSGHLMCEYYSVVCRLCIVHGIAIGGSLAGFLAKKVMNFLSIDQDWLYGISYIVLVTLLWPLSVITVSVFFGQFKFFSNYLKKMGRKLGLLRGGE